VFQPTTLVLELEGIEQCHELASALLLAQLVIRGERGELKHADEGLVQVR
jgi:hypothetical protein